MAAPVSPPQIIGQPGDEVLIRGPPPGETPQKYRSALRSSSRKMFGLFSTNSMKVCTEVLMTPPPPAIRWRVWRISWRRVRPPLVHQGQPQLFHVAKMTIEEVLCNARLLATSAG